MPPLMGCNLSAIVLVASEPSTAPLTVSNGTSVFPTSDIWYHIPRLTTPVDDTEYPREGVLWKRGAWCPKSSFTMSYH